MAGGFVEQQQPGLLCQQHRQRNALTLAPRERQHIALRECGHASSIQRAYCQRYISVALPIPAAQMRVAPQQHGIEHAGIEGVMYVLRHETAFTCEFLRVPAGQCAAIEASTLGRQDSGECMQQRGFADTVGAKQAPEFTAARAPIEPVDQHACAARQRKTSCLQHDRAGLTDRAARAARAERRGARSIRRDHGGAAANTETTERR